MRTLHIAPGMSAGGSLRQAIADAGRDESVLSFSDDLSCGPIDPDTPSVRAAWWAQIYEEAEGAAYFGEFWGRVAATDDRFVVWFGCHSSMELAFFLSWVDRLGKRPYAIVDVTGLRLPYTEQDGSLAVTQPVQAVSIVPTVALKSLFGSEQPFTEQERQETRRHWHRLKEENAPFRVVTASGLVSAPVDYFDPLLLEQATPEWRKIARVVGGTMGQNSEPYRQVGDTMLLTRIVTLVREGKLLADGDPWDMRSCRVRLPG
jgi:hypothetical protein